MASIIKRATASGDTRRDVKFRDTANRHRMRTFNAQRFASTVEADVLRGDWIDPDKGKELLRQFATIALTSCSGVRGARSHPVIAGWQPNRGI